MGKFGGSKTTGTKLSIVVPAYNESHRIHIAKAELQNAITAGILDADQIQLIFVDDGSVDSTRDLMQSELAGLFENTLILGTDVNFGKGHAIALGVKASTSPYTVFMDLDMSVSPRLISYLLNPLHLGADMSMGSRSHPESLLVQNSLVRKKIGRVYSHLTKFMAGVELKDTQCGFKGFRTEVGQLLFHFCVSDRFAFDLDIVLVARQLGFVIEEVPVEWTDVPGSKVRIVRDSLQVMSDLGRSLLPSRRPPIFGLNLDQNNYGFLENNSQVWDRNGSIHPHSFVSGEGYTVLFPLLSEEDVRKVKYLCFESFPEFKGNTVSYSIDQLARQMSGRI